MAYQAMEEASAIASAVREWEQKFSKGGTSVPAMGGIVHWQPRLGVWGLFRSPGRIEGRRKPGNYWNPFGREPNRFRQNMIVEINPPGRGKNTNVQGIIATDGGARWVLHQGRLHPPGIRITEEMFNKASNRRRVPVRFADGSCVDYHKVTNIDGPSQLVQEDVAAFVDECAMVRMLYLFGEDAAEEERNVESAEGKSSPERTGSYTVGGRASTIVVRKHAEVWKALVGELDRLKIVHSNGRVGRFGPDLRTFAEPRVLFEIKSSADSADVQQAIGQLLLYEKLLQTTYNQTTYNKVMVIPDKPSAKVAGALEALGLRILTYTRSARSVRFAPGSVARLFGHKSNRQLQSRSESIFRRTRSQRTDPG